MGQIQEHSPVMLISAVISRYDEAVNWAETELIQAWGPIALRSPPFAFHETSFYEATMGSGLVKHFFAFEQFIDPSTLIERKQLSNQLEQQYKEQFAHEESRPLNLDPGYISQAKLVLATTKDRDHRIYLGKGIYAEVTLHYKKSGWSINRWTYPNYQRKDFHAFFTQCRQFLRDRRS